MKRLTLREEFISKFTVWNSKFKYATLQESQEYPTPDAIADWWLSKIDIMLRALDEEVGQDISSEDSGIQLGINTERQRIHSLLSVKHEELK